jgi:hypothetical protein
MLAFLQAELRHRQARLRDTELRSDLRAQIEEEQACLAGLMDLARCGDGRAEELLRTMIAQQVIAARKTRRVMRLARLTIWRHNQKVEKQTKKLLIGFRGFSEQNGNSASSRGAS